MIQNRQTVFSVGMSMDLTMRNNMYNRDATIYRTAV